MVLAWPNWSELMKRVWKEVEELPGVLLHWLIEKFGSTSSGASSTLNLLYCSGSAIGTERYAMLNTKPHLSANTGENMNKVITQKRGTTAPLKKGKLVHFECTLSGSVWSSVLHCHSLLEELRSPYTIHVEKACTSSYPFFYSSHCK